MAISLRIAPSRDELKRILDYSPETGLFHWRVAPAMRACVDHIDGNKSNNRIDNLRPASVSQNAWNSKKRVNNTSGYKGVSFNAPGRERPWMASIGVNGKRKTIGRYETAEEAHQAYCAAAQALHGEFARAA